MHDATFYMHAGWLTISRFPCDWKVIDDIKANLRNDRRARRILLCLIRAVEFWIVMFLMDLEPLPPHHETLLPKSHAHLKANARMHLALNRYA